MKNHHSCCQVLPARAVGMFKSLPAPALGSAPPAAAPRPGPNSFARPRRAPDSGRWKWTVKWPQLGGKMMISWDLMVELASIWWFHGDSMRIQCMAWRYVNVITNQYLVIFHGFWMVDWMVVWMVIDQCDDMGLNGDLWLIFLSQLLEYPHFRQPPIQGKWWFNGIIWWN